jgi:SAM-dependent methyltransferase
MYTDAEIERWDREWASYLVREYKFQLLPHTAYPEKPPLPDSCEGVFNLSLGAGPPLSLYCHGAAVRDKNVMEMGCGCGNLGKLIARYCRGYLGVDCSGLALAVARLVSPGNCVYLHGNQAEELRRFHGTIDTVVGRFFWIHQNFDTGRRVLEFLRPFLRRGGRVYMDFFWSDPAAAGERFRDTWLTLSPRDALSAEPSAVVNYSFEDVRELLSPSGLTVVEHHVHGASQRRYVVAEL